MTFREARGQGRREGGGCHRWSDVSVCSAYTAHSNRFPILSNQRLYGADNSVRLNLILKWKKGNLGILSQYKIKLIDEMTKPPSAIPWYRSMLMWSQIPVQSEPSKPFNITEPGERERRRGSQREWERKRDAWRERERESREMHCDSVKVIYHPQYIIMIIIRHCKVSVTISMCYSDCCSTVTCASLSTFPLHLRINGCNWNAKTLFVLCKL